MARFSVPMTLIIDAENQAAAEAAAFSAMQDAFEDYDMPTNDPAFWPEVIDYRMHSAVQTSAN